MTNRAYIREADCIGCTKCLAVCPTDAIVGASQMLHTVIEEDCIGCERCVPACPVDCITLLSMPEHLDPALMNHEQRLERKAHFQFLAKRRQSRLKRKQEAEQAFFLAMRDKLRKSL